ncbi:hypothetical protein ACGIF2_06260 [Cellulomonas sp. P22]|uniref:hypothetical protein n=1 Tax=Cellulomonas sp. P22 TaxID=3373189 RepID=UPI0037B1D827
MDTSVLELPAPPATRLRRPGWRDPRLLAGLVMVAGSVALGSWVVQDAQRTVEVYVAAETITPGSGVVPSELVVAEVRLAAGELERYVTVVDGLPADAVAVRVVEAGELVPRSALGTATALDLRPVAVPVGQLPSRDVVPGALVDLWEVPAAARDAEGAAAQPAPHRLATGLTVAEVTRPEGAFSAGGSTVVQVLVPEADLPGVLAAVAGPGTVQVVHVPGTGG